MTGTSCDGIDISAISVDPISLKAHKTYSMPKKLQNKILEIIIAVPILSRLYNYTVIS